MSIHTNPGLRTRSSGWVLLCTRSGVRAVRLRCDCAVQASKQGHDSQDGEGMDGMFKKVEERLQADPKAKEAVLRIAAAAKKVEDIREKQRELEEELQERDSDLRRRQVASEQAVQAALARTIELEEKAAQDEVEAAELQQELLQRERSGMQQDLLENAERIESGKAAAIAAAGGFLGILPSALTTNAAPIEQLLSIGTTLVTCVLFGVVYRYIAAANPENVQLRGGAVAAFGLTRGLALAQSALMNSGKLDIETVASAALLAGQSMLVLGFAAAALELGFQQGVVVMFGSIDAGSETK